MTGAIAEKLIGKGEVLVDRCVSRRSGKEYPAIVILHTGQDGSVSYSMRFPESRKAGVQKGGRPDHGKEQPHPR